MSFGTSNSAATVHTSPLINEASFNRLRTTHSHLENQGVKPEKYDTIITSCGSCGLWSSKQKCV